VVIKIAAVISERPNDPDETEGRALYREEADAVAHRQISYASREKRLGDNDG